MRILLISDSHGDTVRIDEIIRRHQPDQVLHMGDAEIPKDMFRMRMVKGNSYNDDDLPNELVFTLDNKTFFMTHGHLYGVYNDLTTLCLKAKSVQADYCLYGHTHIPDYQEVEGMIIINPGSIRRPRAGFSSYMLLSTNTNDCVLYNLNGEEIKNYGRSS